MEQHDNVARTNTSKHHNKMFLTHQAFTAKRLKIRLDNNYKDTLVSRALNKEDRRNPLQ